MLLAAVVCPAAQALTSSPAVPPVTAVTPTAPLTPAATVTLVVRRPGSPSPVDALPVGAPFQLVLRVEAHAPFPAPRERLRVLLPLYFGYRMAAAPQGAFSDRPGYTRLTHDPGCVTLQFVNPEVGPPLSPKAARFRVHFERPLVRGEVLEVVYGAGDAGSTVSQELAVSTDGPGYKPFLCQRLDADTCQSTEVLASARPAFLPGPPARLEVIAPATVRPGEPFDLRVAARDRFGNAVGGFDGAIEFKCDGPLTPPRALRLAPDSRFFGLARGAIARAPGVYRIEAVSTVGSPASRAAPSFLDAGAPPLHPLAPSGGSPPLRGRSNPVLVRARGPSFYFGDLHVHSGEVSADAYGSMQEVFEWARDIAGLDFVAKSDHSDETTPQHWARSRELVARFDQPGRFAALLGFEWSPRRTWGHRSIVFPGNLGTLAFANRPTGSAPEDLWAAIAPFGGLAIPHMPSAEPINHHHYDWSRHNPELEPAVEIYSQWVPDNDRLSAQDTETNPSGVQRALSLGYHLGIVAGSDSHTGMGGRTGGLAAVQADRLDRTAILEALRERRSFGTSGQRILLDWRAADAEAGQVSPSTTGPVIFEATAHGTGPLDRLEIVRGWAGAPVPLSAVAAFPANGREDVEVAWQEPNRLQDAFYYLRVFQRDGGRAWSSPIWVNRPNAAAACTVWRTRPAPGDWEAGTGIVPSGDVATLSALAGGFEAVMQVAQPGPEADPQTIAYFWARSAPFQLAPGRYRLRYNLSSLVPTYAGCVLMDEAQVNAGYAQFHTTSLTGPAIRSDREFTLRRHSGQVRLLFYFAPMPNRYRVDGLSLDAAVAR